MRILWWCSACTFLVCILLSDGFLYTYFLHVFLCNSTKSSADYFLIAYPVSLRNTSDVEVKLFASRVQVWLKGLMPVDTPRLIYSHLSILSDQRQSRTKHLYSVIRSVCLDAVLHLWWKHPLARSDMDSLHVWVLVLLIVVCQMSLEAREIAIGDFVKDSVLQTLGDCQKKVRLLLPEHALNIKGMMKW